ncbi:hypothetical protein BUALT_Bualt01G0005300 [Buddleja alternifolia]|uniref:Dihydrolipoamide acetyltransferase component of pyruvate dehydrogenase complex n=1 Tax=Buddleja alternifolia TaxID=168488 RepID=A0AAV6YDZ1_9LAMI|nr:hypothetical protein BUALT_Bualt01G0005300 [Buddleja alternifolia]
MEKGKALLDTSSYHSTHTVTQYTLFTKAFHQTLLLHLLLVVVLPTTSHSKLLHTSFTPATAPSLRRVAAVPSSSSRSQQVSRRSAPALSTTMTEGKIVSWVKLEGLSAAVGSTIALLAGSEEELALVQLQKSSSSASKSTPGPGDNDAPKVFDEMPSSVSATVTPAVNAGISNAVELGVDLRGIVGSGPNGRVVAKEVEASTKVSGVGATTTVVASEAAKPSGMEFGSVVPFTTMQSALSRNMVESLAVPTFRVGYAITTDALDALYKKEKLKLGDENYSVVSKEIIQIKMQLNEVIKGLKDLTAAHMADGVASSARRSGGFRSSFSLFRNSAPGNRIAGPPQQLALPAPPGPRRPGNNRTGGAGQGPVKAPFRRLTNSEREELRRKGLCFRCKAPFTPTHDCPMKYLRVLLVEDDEAPLLELEEIEVLPEGEDQEARADDENIEMVALSLCLASGITGPKTMLVRGRMQGEEVTILIDMGATHNFVSLALVEKLGLLVESTRRFGVRLGDGSRVNALGICPELAVQLDSFTTRANFHAFPLGGVDMIFGMAWLETLGDIHVNYHRQEMAFEFEEKKVKLTGEGSAGRVEVSLKTLIHTTEVELCAVVVDSGSYWAVTGGENGEVSNGGRIKSKGITMTALLAKATALALVKHPVVNCSCRDGTFTLSNLGMFGVDRFDAILPPGTGAIMAVGASQPTLVGTKDGRIGLKNQVQVNVTADHRVIYGADLTAFLQTLSKMEDPKDLTL